MTQRIYELNQQLKQGLAAMPHITLHTPMSQDLSAGIVCFEVAGMATPRTVVEKLRLRGIVGSVTPYATQYARLAPSLLELAGRNRNNVERDQKVTCNIVWCPGRRITEMYRMQRANKQRAKG